MTQFIQKLLLHHCKHQLGSNSKPSAQTQSSLGFTLTELLVVVLTASLVVSSLMTLVVQLMSTEQREAARTETQREAQLAINYIASDLRQAVYIYDNSPHPITGNSPGYLEFIPEFEEADGYRPILAFWKTKPIDNIEQQLGAYTYNPNPNQAGGCQDFPDQQRVDECNGLWLKRQTYSMVAYFQVENYQDNDLEIPNGVTNANGKWRGKSRIVRYELDKYSDISGLVRTQGYVDPAEISATDGFVSWPFQGSSSNPVNCQDTGCGIAGSQTGRPVGTPVTLVDFVDFTDHLPANGRDAVARQDEPHDCSSLNAGDPLMYSMMPVPDPGPPPAKPAFFVCIRNANGAGAIQDVVVFLRGNAQGRSVSSDSFLPTLQTRITMRGVIDRIIR